MKLEFFSFHKVSDNSSLRKISICLKMLNINYLTNNSGMYTSFNQIREKRNEKNAAGARLTAFFAPAGAMGVSGGRLFAAGGRESGGILEACAGGCAQ